MSNTFDKVLSSSQGAEAVCHLVRLESLFPSLKRHSCYGSRATGWGGTVAVEFTGPTAILSFSLLELQTTDVEGLLTALLPYIKAASTHDKL